MADWDDYRFAAAVAEAGTVRGAAKALGVHASTVTRRIDHFERRLGMALFVRSVRGLVPTAAGEQVVGALTSVAERLEGLESELRRSSSELAGEVRVSVSPALAARFYMEALRALLAEYPALSVPQVRRWTATDVEKRTMDVAAVALREPPADLIGRPAGAMTLAAFASPELASRWPESCVWLPSRLQQETAPDFAVEGVPSAGALDTVELQVTAVRSGLGASLLPLYQAREDPRLVELPLARARADIWVLSHPDTRGVRRVQLLAARLAETLRETNLADDPDRLA